MDSRTNTQEYNDLKRNVKKFVVYSYENQSAWSQFKKTFEESKIDIKQKMRCLDDVASSYDLSHLGRYGELAAIIVQHAKALPDLLAILSGLKINQLVNQDQYQQGGTGAAMTDFYKGVYEHASKMDLSAAELLQIFKFKEAGVSIADSLKKHASAAHDVWWDFLTLLKRALKEDRATAPAIFNILSENRHNSIAYQTSKHVDLMLLYLSVLNRLHHAGIKAGAMTELLAVKDTNTKRVFADYVFEQSEESVKRRYLLWIKQFEKQSLDMQEGSISQLVGFNFARVNTYSAQKAKYDLAIVKAMLRYGINHAMIFKLFEHQKAKYLFSEAVFKKCGYTPLDDLFKIVNQLLDESKNPEKFWEIFNPLALINEYGLQYNTPEKNASIFKQSLQYCHKLLDRGASAEVIFDQFKAMSGFFVLNEQISEVNKATEEQDLYFDLLNRFMKSNIDADDLFKALKLEDIDLADSSDAFVSRYMSFVCDLYHRGLNKTQIRDELFSDSNKFVKHILGYFGGIAGKIFYDFQLHGLVPASHYSSAMRDKVFDHIKTLGDAERIAAYNHIKDKTHPLAELFWEQSKFLFWKSKASLPKTVADTIRQETGSIKIELVTEALADQGVRPYFDEDSENQPLLESSNELQPVYLGADERKIYNELAGLPAPRSGLSSQGMYAQSYSNMEANQSKPEKKTRAQLG